MNLRFSLIILILGSWIAVGAAWFVDSDFGQAQKEEQPPYFYNIPVDDLRNIKLQTEGIEQSFSFREGVNRWYIEGMEDIPADLFRWGGITTLLGGPRTQRLLAATVDDPAKYGLDNPSSRYTVTLRDGTQRVLLIGDKTVSGESTYAQMEGFPQLVLVDTSWSDVLDRLVTEPPYPEWLYELDPAQVREVLLFKDNEVIRAYGINRETNQFHVCDLPVATDPCTGTTPVDAAAFQAALELIAERKVGGAVALGLENEAGYEPYGAGRNSPYFAIRVERPSENNPNVTEVHRVSMTIGDVTPDGLSRYAVANETTDVIRIDRAWADQILQLFEGEPLVAAPPAPAG
jgi:hypothetical protein